MIQEIQDINAQELDIFARLTEAQLRSKLEPEKGIFIAEGEVASMNAVSYGCKPKALLIDKSKIDTHKDLINAFEGCEIYTADEQLLSALTGYPLTRGIVAAFMRPKAHTLDDILNDSKRVAVLEGLVDPTNIGAIFRSAAALGVDGIIISNDCCTPYHRRAVRVSMGTVFALPFCHDENKSLNESVLPELRAHGFTTAALALTDNALSIRDKVFSDCEKLAIVLGTEGTGLRKETIDACDRSMIIPMYHGVNSLNVAACAAIAFYALCQK